MAPGAARCLPVPPSAFPCLLVRLRTSRCLPVPPRASQCRPVPSGSSSWLPVHPGASPFLPVPPVSSRCRTTGRQRRGQRPEEAHLHTITPSGHTPQPNRKRHRWSAPIPRGSTLDRRNHRAKSHASPAAPESCTKIKKQFISAVTKSMTAEKLAAIARPIHQPAAVIIGRQRSNVSLKTDTVCGRRHYWSGRAGPGGAATGPRRPGVDYSTHLHLLCENRPARRPRSPADCLCRRTDLRLLLTFKFNVCNKGQTTEALQLMWYAYTAHLLC